METGLRGLARRPCVLCVHLPLLHTMRPFLCNWCVSKKRQKQGSCKSGLVSVSWGEGQSKEPSGSLCSDRPVFFCSGNSRGKDLDFPGQRAGRRRLPCEGAARTGAHRWLAGQGAGPWVRGGCPTPSSRQVWEAGGWRCCGKLCSPLFCRGGAGSPAPACQGFWSPELRPSCHCQAQARQGSRLSPYHWGTAELAMGLGSETEIRAGVSVDPTAYETEKDHRVRPSTDRVSLGSSHPDILCPAWPWPEFLQLTKGHLAS